MKATGKHELGPIFPPSLLEAYKQEVDGFIQSIIEKQPSSCNEIDGKSALEIAIAATESYKTGKTITLDFANPVTN